MAQTRELSVALLDKQQLASRTQAPRLPAPSLSCCYWEPWVSVGTQPTQHGSWHDRHAVPLSVWGNPMLLCAVEQTSPSGGTGREQVLEVCVVPAAGVRAAAPGLCPLSSFVLIAW